MPNAFEVLGIYERETKTMRRQKLSFFFLSIFPFFFFFPFFFLFFQFLIFLLIRPRPGLPQGPGPPTVEGDVPPSARPWSWGPLLH